MSSDPPSYTGSVWPQNQQRPIGVIQVIQAHDPPLCTQPVVVICPMCNRIVTTRVQKEWSNKAYICCMLMFVVGCTLCSCLPFCMDNFQNYKHTCPNCNHFIGKFSPS